MLRYPELRCDNVTSGAHFATRLDPATCTILEQPLSSSMPLWVYFIEEIAWWLGCGADYSNLQWWIWHPEEVGFSGPVGKLP